MWRSTRTSTPACQRQGSILAPLWSRRSFNPPRATFWQAWPRLMLRSRPVVSNIAMSNFARRFATDAFTALEHKMWQAGAAAYSDSFAKVTGMATNALLDNANVTLTSPMAVSIVERTPLDSREGGLRVLDVATGPGMVADAAAARGHAEVVALDFSSEMIKRAQACGLQCSMHPALGTLLSAPCSRHPAPTVCALQSVPWEPAPRCPEREHHVGACARSPETPTRAQAVVERHPEGVVQLVEGDAAALPMPDASFDAVTIGFGLLHLPRPHLALAEVCRVLKAHVLDRGCNPCVGGCNPMRQRPQKAGASGCSSVRQRLPPYAPKLQPDLTCRPGVPRAQARRLPGLLGVACFAPGPRP